MGLTSSSVLVACQAVDAVVDISVHVGVVEVGRIVAAVAAGAGEHRVIGRIGVAGGAHAVGIAVVQREEGVITAGQGRRQPRGGGVAGGACRRPACGGVIRIGGSVVVRRMAGVAIGGQRTRVVVVGVAQCAGHGGVSAGQREGGGVVVKRGSSPIRGGVAHVAGGWEAGSRVRRVGGAVVIRHMAAGAKGGQRAVIGGRAGVALHALHGGVEASQRERRGAVIEGGRCPVGGRVADRAVGWESCRHVGRVVGASEVRLVAAIAGRRQVVEVVVGMALHASDGCVESGESVIRVHGVVERHPCHGPIVIGVAGVAVCRESGSCVARVIGTGEVGLVAAVAVGRDRGVVVVGVALRAGQRGM